MAEDQLKSECIRLYEKAKKLKEEDCLYTDFGENKFFIFKDENKIIFECKDWLSKNYKKEISTYFQLEEIILEYPEYYATNAYTGGLEFFDNWINLFNAFKLVKKINLNLVD